jgi:hypothetical protein
VREESFLPDTATEFSVEAYFLTKSSREKNLGREKRESRRDEDCQSSNE